MEDLLQRAGNLQHIFPDLSRIVRFHKSDSCLFFPSRYNRYRTLCFVTNVIYDSFPDNWKPFIKPHVLPDDLYAEQWLKKHQAHASGEEFKSKAEHLHDRIYREFDLPHVYEPKLYLEGFGWVKPDFVVLNRRTRQTFYHEHFGMMDNPEYCARALSKLNAYHRNGYYEGENLLITMESSLHPMDPGEVDVLFRNSLL